MVMIKVAVQTTRGSMPILNYMLTEVPCIQICFAGEVVPM